MTAKIDPQKSLSDLHKPSIRHTLDLGVKSLTVTRRRRSYNHNDNLNKKPANKRAVDVKVKNSLDVTQNRSYPYNTRLTPLSHRLHQRVVTSEINLVSASLVEENRERDDCLSPIIPAGSVHRRISVSKTKIYPPFIRSAAYMIESRRVSFQDLVVCVQHCFQHLMGSKGKVQAPGDDISVKQTCYEIAFNVLKYRTVILDVMNESHFYATYPHLYESLQMVTILCYIQFIVEEPLPKDNIYDTEIRYILRALFAHKIHIDASFARSRIKLNAATVIHLLPEEDREEYEKSTREDDKAPPYYARINKGKNVMDDVIGALQQNFKFYPTAPEDPAKPPEGFFRDPEFKDVLVFNSKLREELTGLPIVKECGLILQERVLSYVVITLQGLMLRGYDIIQTHGGSGSLATYLASVVDGNKCKLRVLGCYPADLPHIQRHVTKQGVKNIDLHCTPFLTYVGPEKPHVQAIVCTPPSTMSGIKEPFRYALYEGDYTVAGEKVQEKTTSLRQFVVHQTKTLRQALTYPKVSTIIYFTLSSNFQENEGVVRNCLEEYNEGCEKPEMRFNAIPVMPAVRKRMLESKDVTQDTTTTKDFFKIVDPEAGFAGGFVTVLYRKMPEDPPPPEEPPAVASRNNTSILPSYSSRNENNINSTTSLTSITQKKKRRQPPKVIAMDPEYGAPVTGDFLKLALNEKGPSLQNFKKDFYQSYEMVMGPGSRAKMKQTMKVIKPKKEPEPVFPKVSQVITKAMEMRKRDKVKRELEHEKIIKHPHPFK